ncbi:hypothetical protein EV177_000765 [Coemansia sp. RSA 1804]|nr:hypothetical protein EV177_000765 [Coemansia sp. RSA 1804]
MVIANVSGYPTIPEMVNDYNIGVDRYNNADKVTVTGSGSSSSSSGNNAPKKDSDNIPSPTAAAPAPTETKAASAPGNNSGGCTHGAMNCAGGSSGYEDLPSSDSAVFSWSWVNASGNREFYQNCADVVIKGTGSTSYTGKKMVIANINGYPTIPEMADDYNIGVDLYNSAEDITVTGSGSTSSSGGNNAPKDNPDNIPSSTAAAPTPTQTPAASTSNNNSGGCTHGAMNCASGSSGYEVCVWGTKTPMPCAPGTACKTNGAGSILCDYA